MNSLLKDWIAPLVASELKAVVEAIKARDGKGLSHCSREGRKLSIRPNAGRIVERHVQILGFNGVDNAPWRVILGEGTTQVIATFNGDFPKQVANHAGAKFHERMVGSVLSIRDYELTCDLKTPSLTFHISNFTFQGGRRQVGIGASAMLEHKQTINKYLERIIQLSYSNILDHLLVSQGGSHSDSPHKSPPSFMDAATQFMTQLPLSDHVKDSANVEHAPTDATIADGSLAATSKSAGLGVSVMDVVHSSQSSLRRAQGQLENFDTGPEAKQHESANDTQSHIGRQSSSCHPDRSSSHDSKEITTGSRSKSTNQACQVGVSEDEINHAGIKAGKFKAINYESEQAKSVENLVVGIQMQDGLHETIFEGLTRIPRREVRIPRDQQTLLVRQDAWYQPRHQNCPYASIPTKDVQDILAYWEGKSIGDSDCRADYYEEEKLEENRRKDDPALLRDTSVAVNELSPSLQLSNKSAFCKHDASSDQSVIGDGLSEVEEVSWPSSPLREPRKVETEKQPSTTSSSFNVKGQALVSDSPDAVRLTTIQGQRSISGEDMVMSQVPLTEIPKVSQANPSLAQSVVCYVQDRLPTDSAAEDEELEIAFPRAICDSLEEDIKTNDDLTATTQAPPCGQPYAPSPNLPSFEIERTPIAGPKSSTMLQSSQPIIPATFSDEGILQYANPKVSPPRSQGLKRNLNNFVEDREGPKSKRQKNVQRNIDALNFTQEHQQHVKGIESIKHDKIAEQNLAALDFTHDHGSHNIKDILRGERRNFKEARRFVNATDSEAEIESNHCPIATEEACITKIDETNHPQASEHASVIVAGEVGGLSFDARRQPSQYLEGANHENFESLEKRPTQIDGGNLQKSSAHSEYQSSPVVEARNGIHAVNQSLPSTHDRCVSSQSAHAVQTSSPEPRAIEEPSNHSNMFENYRSTYPSYVGTVQNFVKVSVYLEWLQNVKRAPPQYTWDDFIRAYTAYIAYVKSCQESGLRPSTYIDYYNAENEELQYDQRIITARSLQEAIAVDSETAEHCRKRFRGPTKPVKQKLVSQEPNVSDLSQLQQNINRKSQISFTGDSPKDLPPRDSQKRIKATQDPMSHLLRKETTSLLEEPVNKSTEVAEPSESIPEVDHGKAHTIAKKRYFKTTSQIPALSDRISIKDPAEDLSPVPRATGVSTEPTKARSSRRLPWSQGKTSFPLNINDIKIRPTSHTPIKNRFSDGCTGSKQHSVPQFHMMMPSKLPVQRSTSVQISGAPIVSREAPNGASTPTTVDHSPSDATRPAKFVLSTTSTSRPSSQRSRSSPNTEDSGKVQEWLSPHAPPETRSMATKSPILAHSTVVEAPITSSWMGKPINLVELCQKVKAELANQGKSEADMDDILKYYVPNRKRRSGKYNEGGL